MVRGAHYPPHKVELCQINSFFLAILALPTTLAVYLLFSCILSLDQTLSLPLLCDLNTTEVGGAGIVYDGKAPLVQG